MIFRFFSVLNQTREVILIDFCKAGWYLRYHQHAEFSDRNGQPTLQKWIEENGCVFPDGLSDAIGELWTALHNKTLTEAEGQNRLNRFAEWLNLFNK